VRSKAKRIVHPDIIYQVFCLNNVSSIDFKFEYKAFSFDPNIKVSTSIQIANSSQVIVKDADLSTQFLTEKGSIGSPYSITM